MVARDRHQIPLESLNGRALFFRNRSDNVTLTRRDCHGSRGKAPCSTGTHSVLLSDRASASEHRGTHGSDPLHFLPVRTTLMRAPDAPTTGKGVTRWLSCEAPLRSPNLPRSR